MITAGYLNRCLAALEALYNSHERIIHPDSMIGVTGCIVKDVDGDEFIYLNSGLAALNVGHCHPKVRALSCHVFSSWNAKL
jgi:4-aminobutyrate aminotransferase-like enzyme